jgi:hypothetical protein
VASSLDEARRVPALSAAAGVIAVGTCWCAFKYNSHDDQRRIIAYEATDEGNGHDYLSVLDASETFEGFRA